MSGALRSRADRVIRALLGALWFEFWFFGAFPAALLFASGAGWVPAFGLHWLPGAAVLLGAHALMIATIAELVATGGTQLPFDPPGQLVRHGLYRHIRNPMYSAYVAIAAGEAIVYRSAALAGYAIGIWALIHMYLTQIEEPGLRARFGDAYLRYCDTTGRWLPRRSAAAQFSGRRPG